MSIADPLPSPVVATAPFHFRRTLGRSAVQWMRRLHLYFGLLLFPWAILYGVTAFLFNHPSAFSDLSNARFGPAELEGTPMEHAPTASETAGRVVEALRERDPDSAYALVEPSAARYAREFATVTARTKAGEQVTLRLDVNGGGGSLRTRPKPADVEQAPFAVSPKRAAAGRGKRGGKEAPRQPGKPTGLAVADSLHQRMSDAAPVVLGRLGIDASEATVAVPDLTFRMEADGRAWNVTHNASAGSVAGTPADTPSGPGLSVRRFLTRLHTTHGYPDSGGPKWSWAVVVDVMAFVMVFWGVSGLFMWWQLKATRVYGLLALLVGGVTAATMAFAMYGALAV